VIATHSLWPHAPGQLPPASSVPCVGYSVPLDFHRHFHGVADPFAPASSLGCVPASPSFPVDVESLTTYILYLSQFPWLCPCFSWLPCRCRIPDTAHPVPQPHPLAGFPAPFTFQRLNTILQSGSLIASRGILIVSIEMSVLFVGYFLHWLKATGLPFCCPLSSARLLKKKTLFFRHL
jgi:hypothetical protein